MKALFPISLVLLGLGCASTSTKTPDEATEPETPAFLEPIDLIPEATGTHSWKITTNNAKAQAYFNQGMQLRWAYNVDEAARSMAEARRLDPNCAMCFWGEAFALGSFLNGGMSKTKAARAHEAIEQAAALREGLTPVERDLIDAARVRYPNDYDPEERRPVDEAFAKEMAALYEKYPDHHEVAVVYAVSLFLLEERLGRRDLEDPDLIRLHQVLTGVLDEDIKHPGACHLYAHATESTDNPGLALDCVEHLGSAIPIASHIQHMPSHTWNEVGYWGRSVKANIQAWHSDLKARENKGFSYAANHNLHMLVFAASMDGQGAVAMRAGKEYSKLGGNTMYEVLTLFRFGKFDEIVQVRKRPTAEVPGGFWEFAQGYAQLKLGNAEKAAEHLAKVKELAETSEARFRFHDAEQLMGLAAALLEGEILWSEGNLEGAIESFQLAAQFDDEQQYDEPEPINFAARHWLGAALLEAERYEEAESEYRTELADHPHNVWSLFGLRQALAAQGKEDPAVEEDWKKSSERGDTWITSSRF